MNIRLMDDRVLVKPDPIVTKTTGGIILPGAEEKIPRKGTIVALGPDYELNQLVKLGDHVVWPAMITETLETDEGTFILLNREDLLAVIE